MIFSFLPLWVSLLFFEELKCRHTFFQAIKEWGIWNLLSLWWIEGDTHVGRSKPLHHLCVHAISYSHIWETIETFNPILFVCVCVWHREPAGSMPSSCDCFFSSSSDWCDTSRSIQERQFAFTHVWVHTVRHAYIEVRSHIWPSGCLIACSLVWSSKAADLNQNSNCNRSDSNLCQSCSDDSNLE